MLTICLWCINKVPDLEMNDRGSVLLTCCTDVINPLSKVVTVADAVLFHEKNSTGSNHKSVQHYVSHKDQPDVPEKPISRAQGQEPSTGPLSDIRVAKVRRSQHACMVCTRNQDTLNMCKI